ncbi:MAG: group II intron reverse transcriptase/maturase [Erysipelotrichaceae bacterium]|nr:group II intron reverse transcriptase/maturase [Erysipelotrichaceae bacterium]
MSVLLDKILDNENIYKAIDNVSRNKGTCGIDGMKVDELHQYMGVHLEEIKSKIKARSYYPLPVRRVEIPKPNGKKRKLGIPVVVDRVIQQAMVQVLSPVCEPYFSEYSYGFRPGRCCETAIVKELEYFNDGYDWVVDIDLEKFFDNVPHDKLMSYVHNIINDGDVESLIYKYLRAGIMIDGAYEESEVGTPQGGNLSPLLSNIILNELDKELEARGLRFARYADDCVILLKSEASAKRVMYSITKWIEKKLGLKVNAEKTKIVRPWKLKYLGFGFYKDSKSNTYYSRPHEDSINKFTLKLKSITSRKWSMNFHERIKKLNEVIRGWVNYFSITNMKWPLIKISAHLRTRLRMVLWKQWKVPSKRQWALQKLGIDKDLARCTAYCGNRYYWIATKTCVKRAISKNILIRAGLVDPLDYYLQRHTLKLNQV